MNDETTFRLLIAMLAFSGFGISIYYRRRADRSGGRVSRLEDGRLFVLLQLVWVLALLGSLVLYLVMTNWFTGLMTVLTFAAIARRTRGEEAALVERFGDEYRDYVARTPRYLPSWRGSPAR